jgi:predicted nucleic acid-binding protein
MIIVDSGVWIDYFNGRTTPQTDTLDVLLSAETLGIGDIILTEVLQGFRSDSEYRSARKLLTALPIMEMLGLERAIRSADNFRSLRKRGITIRKTIDAVIATFCIDEGHSLLFSDSDFLPFVQYLGLHQVPAEAP